MVYKVVFHLNLPDEVAFNQGLNNITNLLKSIPGQEQDVIMLFNGPAVSLVAGEGVLPFHERIKELHAQGVRFQACRNALQKFEVDPDTLVAEGEIIPAGITALIELQNTGFAYIKP
ncbi:MAG: DsrE family protein [Desulfurivibrionaceae bacterium]|nr:DsrE family protein [Desulfurivibrionaceae bacterium]